MDGWTVKDCNGQTRVYFVHMSCHHGGGGGGGGGGRVAVNNVVEFVVWRKWVINLASPLLSSSSPNRTTAITIMILFHKQNIIHTQATPPNSPHTDRGGFHADPKSQRVHPLYYF